MFIWLQEIHNVGESLGIKAVVIRGEELKTRGFGGKFTNDLSV